MVLLQEITSDRYWQRWGTCNFFTIPKVHKVFDDEGKLLDKNYERRFSRFLEEFEWYVSALERLERLIDYAQSLVLGITL